MYLYSIRNVTTTTTHLLLLRLKYTIACIWETDASLYAISWIYNRDRCEIINLKKKLSKNETSKIAKKENKPIFDIKTDILCDHFYIRQYNFCCIFLKLVFNYCIYFLQHFRNKKVLEDAIIIFCKNFSIEYEINWPMGQVDFID